MQEENIQRIDAALLRFEAALRTNALVLCENLALGIENSYINEMLGKLSINEQALTRIYQWKNGIAFDKCFEIVRFDFCSSGKLLPLDNAISIFVANKYQPYWRKTLFPIITTNAGDFLLYDTDKKSKTHQMILFYSAELLITKPETAYDDLTALFETLGFCYENRIYIFDPNTNTLAIDYEKEAEASLQKNPKSVHWKE